MCAVESCPYVHVLVLDCPDTTAVSVIVCSRFRGDPVAVNLTVRVFVPTVWVIESIPSGGRPRLGFMYTTVTWLPNGSVISVVYR